MMYADPAVSGNNREDLRNLDLSPHQVFFKNEMHQGKTLLKLIRMIFIAHTFGWRYLFLAIALIPSGTFGQIGQSWQERAEAGSAFAQANLGIMYAQGEGVPEDDAEAVKWFRLAAEQGHAAAQYSLGVMYAAGDGVPQSYITAHAWWNIASASGHGNASRNLAVIERRLEISEIEEAQALALELNKTIQTEPESE